MPTVEIVSMARPGIPTRAPTPWLIPLIPDPMPQREPLRNPVPAPIEPAKKPQEPIPVRQPVPIR